MKDYPVGHRFYKEKGLAHVEGKIPVGIKARYRKKAKQNKWSMIDVISDTLIKYAPKG